MAETAFNMNPARPRPLPAIEQEQHARAQMNTARTGFDADRDLPPGLGEFLRQLDAEFTPRQQTLLAKRAATLAEAQRGRLPSYLPPSPATTTHWKISLPEWCLDQRNQMTGPADDAELVVKMLNSGAPGVMLDLEDSMANTWPHLMRGIGNVWAALGGSLTYFDKKRARTVSIQPSRTVIFTRPRGLHVHQAGVLPGRVLPAAVFDVSLVAWQLEAAKLRHPLCFYIPKSESAEEAAWWRDLFQAVERAKGWPKGWIKCMALVESHPLAFQMEEFAYLLREHLIGLNLGRWDYMASLIHFNLQNPEWVLPDRNTIPHNVAFFQNLRERLPEVCHKHGMLAIGGMTALYPSREDAELNQHALAVLAEDKKNEATCLMDGAWTGHPDQNQIAVEQFPFPNQLHRRPADLIPQPDLRPMPRGVGQLTTRGTRAAVRTVIRYRHGVLCGKGASLLDGYMEDLATDRIYRLMIAQRMLHRDRLAIFDGDGLPVPHTLELIQRLFNEETDRLIRQLPADASPDSALRIREAARLSWQMIERGDFDPV